MQLRKPLVIIAVFYAFALCLAAFLTGEDIPQGGVTILSFVIPAIICGYYGSSAYEHCYGPKSLEGISDD